MSDKPQEWEQTKIMTPRPDPMTATATASSGGPGAEKGTHSFEDRDYYEMRLTSIDEKNVMRVEGLARELTIRMAAADTAILKAEAAVNERLLKMNEFREQLTDQAATFSTRAAMESLEATVVAKIETVQATSLAEVKGLRETMIAKIDAVDVASQVRFETARRERETEMKNMWRFVYGLGISIATLQAILEFGNR